MSETKKKRSQEKEPLVLQDSMNTLDAFLKEAYEAIPEEDFIYTTYQFTRHQRKEDKQ